MRKLASVRKILEIKPIKDADNIEAVRVDGWWCVAKKGEFKVDDLCIYFEIDSFLPVRPEFEFLRKSCFKSTKNLGDGFRLKTIKLKGQISQGLVLPIDTFLFLKYPEENDDLTGYLNVQKYEQPLPAQLAGNAKGVLPSFLRKTDQERIQNCYEEFKQKYSDTVFFRTLKLDGSSMTVYYKDGVFGVCSRNLELIETEDNTFWKVARKLDLENILRSYGKNIALQGELMGPGIQGNREQLKDHNFYIFDIWNIDTGMYEYNDPKHISETLETVPKLNTALPFTKTLEELIADSDIKSMNHDVAEGIVYKNYEHQVSFKVINNKFLLGEK